MKRTGQLLSSRQAALSCLLALLLLAGGPLGTGAAQAQEQQGLGRLFFSPLQRQELDRRRASNAQAATVTVTDFVTINGRVSRSSGKSTTWINGEPQEDTYRGADASRVRIPKGEDAGEVSLRVGETHDRVKGETRSGLGEGSITVRRNTR